MALVAVIGCTGAPGEQGPPALPGTEEPPCILESRFYRIDELTLPKTIEEVEDSGLNLDSPSDAEVGIAVKTDNAIGLHLLDLFERFGLDATAALQMALDSRSLSWILELQVCADPSNDNLVRMVLHVGIASTTDSVTGSEVVLLSPDNHVPAQGSRVDGHISVAYGTGPAPASSLVDLDGTGPVAWVAGLSVTALFDEQGDDSLSGLIGLGLEAPMARLAIVNFVMRSLNQMLADDPGCPGACASEQTRAILEQLDDDADGAVSTSEIESDVFLAAQLHGGLDLVAEHAGQVVYWPNHDRRLDHVSLGLPFHAVPVLVSR